MKLDKLSMRKLSGNYEHSHSIILRKNTCCRIGGRGNIFIY